MGSDFANRGDYMREQPTMFNQNLYEESSTQKMPLGHIRRLADGREFIYCKAGAANIAAGVLIQGIAPDVANVANLAITANAAVGAKVLSITMGDSTLANTANALTGGYAYINTGAGNGCSYKIDSHAAIAANANGNIALSDKVRVAIAAATSKVSLSPQRENGVIIHPSPPTASVIGATTFPVTANYYFYAQKKGPCSVLANGTVVNGDKVIPSAAVDGSVSPITANTSETEMPVGMCMANNANAHFALIDLNL